MSRFPFDRPRARFRDFEDIIGTHALPTRTAAGVEGLRGVSSLRGKWSVTARCTLLAVLVVGCAPLRPIAPVRVTSSETAPAEEFDAYQRARLERLHAALAKPFSSTLPPSSLPSSPSPSPSPSSSSESSRGLLVRLAFEEAADLDLFVTDPMQESVYFANSPTRSGGVLVLDRRCQDPSPRVEVVYYDNPVPGRYRVGVDFHRRCQDTSLSGAEEKEGLYVVRVEDGARVLVSEGKVSPGQFEVIVIEFDLEQRVFRSGGLACSIGCRMLDEDGVPRRR